MSFTPIKWKRAYVQIAEQVIDLIDRGEYPPGSQLPSERELAERLEVSRTSVREALSALQMLGLVETKHGQGTFVSTKKVSPSQFLGSWIYDAESPFTLLQARQTIEPQIAALAASQRSEADLNAIERILELVKLDLSDFYLFSKGDREFHQAIAEATGNSVLIGIMSFIYELMGQDLWLTLLRNTHLVTPDRWQQAMEEHQGIYEAIKLQDAQLAATMMREHLERVEQVMLEAELNSSQGLTRS